MFPSFISKYRAVDAIAFTSMLCISLVLLAYILIPTASKSNMQKFSVAASVFILTSTKTFTMFQSYNSTFCANSIQGATFHNARCGVQAFILAFGIHSSVLWASMRAYTVLALITYQRNSKSVRWTVGSNLVCWGVPLCFASGTIGSRSVGYAFGGSCAARTNLQVGLFLVPPIIYTVPAFIAEIMFLVKTVLIFRRSPDIIAWSNTPAMGSSIAKDAPNTPCSETSADTLGLMNDLAGSRGQLRQRGALKRVLILNWRGILHTTTLMVFTNYATITWLRMIKEANDNKFLEWFQCVLTLGTAAKCETFAMEIVDLQAIWTVELILSLLGIKLLVFEASRTEWWLGWRDLSLKICQMRQSGEVLRGYRTKIFRAETPAISEVSSIVYIGHASKTPRLQPVNRVFLNRELPTLPDARESKISVMSLESGASKSREEEGKGVHQGSRDRTDEMPQARV